MIGNLTNQTDLSRLFSRYNINIRLTKGLVPLQNKNGGQRTKLTAIHECFSERCYAFGSVIFLNGPKNSLGKLILPIKF